ncbi:hypothetical protein ScPMuIL_004345 [Solemya velum]
MKRSNFVRLIRREKQVRNRNPIIQVKCLCMSLKHKENRTVVKRRNRRLIQSEESRPIFKLLKRCREKKKKRSLL